MSRFSKRRRGLWWEKGVTSGRITNVLDLWLKILNHSHPLRHLDDQHYVSQVDTIVSRKGLTDEYVRSWGKRWCRLEIRQRNGGYRLVKKRPYKSKEIINRIWLLMDTKDIVKLDTIIFFHTLCLCRENTYRMTNLVRKFIITSKKFQFSKIGIENFSNVLKGVIDIKFIFYF